MTRAKAAMVGIVAALAVGGVVVAARIKKDAAPCGVGFTRAGSRCCPSGSSVTPANVCMMHATAACPPPLVATDHGCDAPEHDVVDVPATTVVVGPSDWEAEGRVASRVVKVDPFSIDRLEVSSGRLCARFSGAPSCDRDDAARAASGISLSQAREFCAGRGGRLPTEDEWLAAAGGDRPRRYPWGDTGAVCRRAAWGLESGPCGDGGDGPDTVGAHPEGVTPLGIHDLAGNVAEWVDTPCVDPKVRCSHVVRGGSWKTRLATELRTWLRREVPHESERGGDRTIGFRCAYDAR